MFHLANRNLILFFRDKSAVCLSFLAEVIVVVLYALFIRDNLLKQFSDMKHAKLLMDTWMIAGILGITSVTTTMGAYGIMVEDRAKGIWRDFLITPVKRYQMVGGYMLAAFFIGVIMSAFVLMLSGIYIRRAYHVALFYKNGVKLLGIIMLTTLSNASMVIFVVSFLKSSNALASCCTIIGSLIGFLTGIYLPMGNLPDAVQKVIRSFPLSHGVVLFRKLLMNPLLKDSFGNENPAQEVFMNVMGIQFVQGKKIVPFSASIIVLLFSGLFFGVLTVFRMTRMKDK